MSLVGLAAGQRFPNWTALFFPHDGGHEHITGFFFPFKGVTPGIAVGAVSLAICSADDFDAESAEHYGWVNRVLTDAEFDAFVENFARRVASFDKNALAIAKTTIIARSGGPVNSEDLLSTPEKFFDACATPAAQSRIRNFSLPDFNRRASLK